MVRIAISVAMIAPVAFLMGMPFPAGLRRVQRESSSLVAWAWAVNAGASVFGSVVAVLASMANGFPTALWVGIGAYAVSLAAISFLSRRSERATQAGSLA